MIKNEERYIIRLRGLPWAATEDDVSNFLGNVQIVNGDKGINLTYTPEGRATGEAYVEVASSEDVKVGLGKDKHLMGKRYIEVFRSNLRELDYVLNQNSGNGNGGEPVVKLRGLPFNCSKEEIAQFFSGLEIVPNGISIVCNEMGKGNGEAYVEFASPDIAEKALGKHKEKIGHRYIEIFKSSSNESYQSMSGGGQPSSRGGRNRNMRSGPYDRPPQRGGRGRGGMRGAGSRGGGPGLYGGGGRGMRRPYDDGLGNASYDNYNNYEEDYGDDYGLDYEQNDSWGGRGGGGGGSIKGYGRGRYGGRGGMNDGYSSTAGNYGNQGGYEDEYGDGSGTSQSEFVVHMRGLPFKISEQDVHNFFAPILPERVEFEYGGDGRMTGEADAMFSTQNDAQRAMQKDKQRIMHRYIELFMRKPMRGGRGGGTGRPNYNMGDNYQQF